MAVWWVLQVGESVIKDAFGSFVANPLQNAVQDEVPGDPLPLMRLTCLNNGHIAAHSARPICAKSGREDSSFHNCYRQGLKCSVSNCMCRCPVHLQASEPDHMLHTDRNGRLPVQS